MDNSPAPHACLHLCRIWTKNYEWTIHSFWSIHSLCAKSIMRFYRTVTCTFPFESANILYSKMKVTVAHKRYNTVQSQRRIFAAMTKCNSSYSCRTYSSHQIWEGLKRKIITWWSSSQCCQPLSRAADICHSSLYTWWLGSQWCQPVSRAADICHSSLDTWWLGSQWCQPMSRAADTCHSSLDTW
jgi:hypothetical protein